MNRTIFRRAMVPGVAALAMTLTACGGDTSEGDSANADGGDTGSSENTAGDDASSLSGSLAGAGASSQGAAMEAWIAGFAGVAPDVTVTYDPIGSGGGRDQFTSGGVAFAGSDAYLDEEEVSAAQETCGGDFIEFPAYISPIAVAYNLPGVEELNLSPSVMAQIFDMQITQWNDPAIQELNEGVELPDMAITPVHRSDESGTTENFVDYLSQAAPEDWSYEVSGDWPVQGGEAAAQTQGVAQALNGGEGTIGYLDASQVGDLGVASVQVGEEFVAYSPEASAAAVDAAERVEGRGEHSYAIDLPRDTEESGVYPIVLVSYQLACTSYDDANTAELVQGFFSYLISEEGQQMAAEHAGSAPISETLRGNAQEAIDAISAG
ncbi:phosphate ABC transporter substrate-binding protein PstS [Ornithinicoccus halotolerans]|uniref:phosphate ABC transporter substrate-binding protein PstS n=1 Tax=Ornithinicoccus halotolerans TaxID=1748220 RepID=UPI001E34FE99|nr:phosphate ABC transporter substrate-binding protein PstS [Ornithinicoccus halotolerans]